MNKEGGTGDETTMKCTAMKLAHRDNFHIMYKRQKAEDQEGTRFHTSENHSYCYPFLKAKYAEPSLSIIELKPPENIKSFNTGSSLEKWSHKPARLKSSKRPIPTQDDTDFCYETLETDFSELLNELDEGFVDNLSSDSLSNLQYELHSDIEQLLLKSQRTEAEDEEGNEEEEKPVVRKSRKKHGRDQSDKSKNTNRRKTIKFSISKPPSPQTEQVIRVDVMSVIENVAGPRRKDHDGRKLTDNMIDDGEHAKKFSQRDEYTFRCKQLTLKHSRKKRTY